MEIQKPGDERSIYQKEIQQGVKIFQESFKGLQETKKFPEKKIEYEKAMDESLQAIQDAASALMNQKLIQMKEQLSKDYHVYLDDPTNQNAEKVDKDLDSLRESNK